MTCATCKGTGKIVTEFATNCGVSGSSSSLCHCRVGLPRRHGDAYWWTCDTPVVEEWSPGWWLGATVTITPELPVSADNYPLIRTAANTYGFWPSVTLAIEGDMVLNPDELRGLAEFLNRMADRVEAIDKPADCPGQLQLAPATTEER